MPILFRRPVGIVRDSLTARQTRAITMLASGIVPQHQFRSTWDVPASRGGKSYRVGCEQCNCPDDHPECKHVWLIRYWLAHVEELKRRLDAGDETPEELERQYDDLLFRSRAYQPPSDSGLLTSIRLEAIDDDSAWRRKRGVQYVQDIRPVRRPWVAKLGGLCSTYEFQRHFMDAKKDYREANKRGNRGVWWYYCLPEGLYEIFELLSSTKDRRYFARVVDQKLVEIDKADVIAEMCEAIPCPS